MMFNNKWFRFWKVIPKNNKIFFSNNKKSEAHESIVNSSAIFFEWKESIRMLVWKKRWLYKNFASIILEFEDIITVVNEKIKHED